MTYTDKQKTIVKKFFDNYPIEQKTYSKEESDLILETLKQASVEMLQEAHEQKSLALLRDARTMQSEVGLIIQASMNAYLEQQRKSGLVSAGNGVSLDPGGWKK